MAVVKGPLNYINGQRVESSNKNAEDDMNVIEPATGFFVFYCFTLLSMPKLQPFGENNQFY